MFNIHPSIPAYVFSLLFLPAIFATNSIPHYPVPISKHISDYVGALQSSDTLAIACNLSDFEHCTGVECTVVIIDAISNYAPGASLETFATNLFNNWGIGNRSKNNGILLLVALQDHKVRIELGAGYGKAAEKTAAKIINNSMLPLFKESKTKEAIMAGCNAIIKGIAPQPVSPWVWYAIIFGLIFFGIIAFFSVREALRHDTSYGFTPKETSRSWLYYSLFGVNNHYSTQSTRSHYSDYTRGSFGGGRSGGGGASGGW